MKFRDADVTTIGWKIGKPTENLASWLGISDYVKWTRYQVGLAQAHFDRSEHIIVYGEGPVRDSLFETGFYTHSVETRTWLRPVLEHLLGPKIYMLGYNELTTHLIVHEVAHALDHSQGNLIKVVGWQTYVYAPGSVTAIKESGNTEDPVYVHSSVCKMVDHGPTFREAVSEIWCDHGLDLLKDVSTIIKEVSTTHGT